jgi:hypothetical protein
LALFLRWSATNAKHKTFIPLPANILLINETSADRTHPSAPMKIYRTNHFLAHKVSLVQIDVIETAMNFDNTALLTQHNISVIAINLDLNDNEYDF